MDPLATEIVLPTDALPQTSLGADIGSGFAEFAYPISSDITPRCATASLDTQERGGIILRDEEMHMSLGTGDGDVHASS